MSPMCAAAAVWSTSSNPSPWFADLQAVERPPPRRACSKSARMMTSPPQSGHVTGAANHTSTAKRVPPASRDVARVLLHRRGTEGRVWLRTATGTRVAV